MAALCRFDWIDVTMMSAIVTSGVAVFHEPAVAIDPGMWVASPWPVGHLAAVGGIDETDRR